MIVIPPSENSAALWPVAIVDCAFAVNKVHARGVDAKDPFSKFHDPLVEEIKCETILIFVFTDPYIFAALPAQFTVGNTPVLEMTLIKRKIKAVLEFSHYISSLFCPVCFSHLWMASSQYSGSSSTP
jgi:hypothetical protein